MSGAVKIPRAQLEPDSFARPSHVRYGVLGLACTLSMVTYLDRACVASAAPAMVRDLHLTAEGDLKWAFAAFGFAYALFEVPSGWLGDVFGPRRVLIRIVLWWSLFTALTGVVGLTVGGCVMGGLFTLGVVRFLFGIGEAGAYPNITRALHNWFPYSERGFTQGAVWMAGRLMGGLTPLVWMFLVEGMSGRASPGQPLTVISQPLLHWRATFWLFAVMGLLWCLVFAAWFRNRPEEKPAVNAAELALIRGGGAGAPAHAAVPWREILRSRNLWILCLMYACQSYGWYFYLTYLPSFLANEYGMKANDVWGAIYKGGPLWAGAVGCLVGGLLTDWFIRRTGNRRLGRRLFGALGHGLTAVCFLLCPLTHTATTFFLVMSLSGFFTDLTMGSSWAVCQDIGRRYAAIVAGFMNMVGNLGGAVGPLLSGYVLSHALERHAARLGVSDPRLLSPAQKAVGLLPGYHANFYIFAGVFVIGTLCWLRIDSTRPVTGE